MSNTKYIDWELLNKKIIVGDILIVKINDGDTIYDHFGVEMVSVCYLRVSEFEDTEFTQENSPMLDSYVYGGYTTKESIK